ncbi:hypothetical protein PM082_019517 [Marasmius tenuissimus]|nr:hypothetical protein PM082_019517 [Marasmius tenuissimus]
MTEPVCLIPGNPDIAGIGVRAAVYVQACLVALNAAFTLVVDCPERFQTFPTQNLPSSLLLIRHRPSYKGNMKTLERSVYMIGLAIIISAFIELRATISSYHALIVLNISIINTFAASLIFDARGGVERWSLGWKSSSFMAIAHSTLVSVFGVYYWAKPESFLAYVPTEAPPCRPMSELWLFVPISTTTLEFRIVSLSFYATFLVFTFLIGRIVLFLALFSTLMCRLAFHYLLEATLLGIARAAHIIHTFVLARVQRQPTPSSDSGVEHNVAHRLLFPICTLSFILPTIFMIVSTEEMVRLYSPHLIEQESNWTYGQTLALCSALVSTVICVYDWWKMWTVERRTGSEARVECQPSPGSTPSRDVERGTQQDADVFPFYDYLG